MADDTTTQNLSGGGADNQSGRQDPASHDASRQQQTTPERPAYVPETFWDADKREVKSEAAFGELKKFADERAAAEQRKASLPKTPGEYAFTPPEGFKLPEFDHRQDDGTVVKKQAEIDPADPQWNKLQTLAHAEGLTPEQFSKFGALAINYRLDTVAAINKAGQDFIEAQQAKLGDNSKARVEAVNRFVETNFPAEVAADFKAGGMHKASTAMVIEKLISELSSNGITAFNGNGRDQGRADGKPSNWEQMSPVDRLAFIRRNERQQQSNGARR